MLSRVADSLYWMSRYLERAENTVRQLDVTMSLMLDTGGPNVETRWQRMMAALGKPDGHGVERALEPMARKLVFDPIDPASVTYCVNAARENARQVREEISTEQWQRLNRLYHQIHSPARAVAVQLQRQRHAGVGHRRHLSLQRHHRYHHDPRPGMAVHPPRPLP